MKKISAQIYNNRYLLTVIFLIAVGIFVRVYNFGMVPNGFNQDEAFAAYEAYSLLNFGKDSAGYTNPTYFVSWGSGMNVLESYLAIPFFYIFGVSETVFRLPQLICGIISLPIIYFLIKRLFNRKIALIGLFLIAIAPWHIMLCRWGLESNLAPSFLLFGFFFLIKGIQKNIYFIFSAMFYGISLYSYSITWLFVPITIIAVSIYLFYSKTKINIRILIIAVIILAVFALPHILFLLINKGIIPEIRTSFISIPKMVSMRGGEINVMNIFSVDSWKNLMNILLFQNDNLIWNSTEKYGMFYLISSLFLLIGIIKLIVNIVKDFKDKKFSNSFTILLGFVCSIFVCLILSGLNINKSNCMHFYSLIIIAIGLGWFFSTPKIKLMKYLVVGIYIFNFLNFNSFYFNDYNNIISHEFRSGVGDAVEFINDNNIASVSVDQSIYHSQILFYDKTPQDEFVNTVEYANFPSQYLTAYKFGKYTFDLDYGNLGEYDGYLILSQNSSFFDKNLYDIVMFDNYGVAIKK